MGGAGIDTGKRVRGPIMDGGGNVPGRTPYKNALDKAAAPAGNLRRRH